MTSQQFFLKLLSHELLPKVGQLCNLLHSDKSKLPIAENCTFGLNWPWCTISCHMKVRSWEVRLCTSIFLKQMLAPLCECGIFGIYFSSFNKLKIHLCGRELSLLERDPTIIAVMLLTFLLKVFNQILRSFCLLCRCITKSVLGFLIF